MFTTVLYVALGGAIGAAARYGVVATALRYTGDGFPLGVMLANIVGSFIMGLVVVYLMQKNLMQFGPFLLTGVLGGFTTFSAFSLEAITMFERGLIGQAVLYVGLSVLVSLLALAIGAWLMRSVLI